MRLLFLPLVLAAGPVWAVDGVAFSVLPTTEDGIYDFAELPFGAIPSGTKIGNLTLGTAIDGDGKLDLDESGLVAAEVTKFLPPFPGSDDRNLHFMGGAWVTNAAPAGLSSPFNAGHGVIALSFEPAICAVGLEFAQFGKLKYGTGQLRRFDIENEFIEVTFNFYAEDGELIDTETRSPLIIWNILAFETSKGDAPIATMSIASKAEGGLGLTKVIAIPCSLMVS